MSPETVPKVALCWQQVSPRCRELLLVLSEAGLRTRETFQFFRIAPTRRGISLTR